jgi:hypothetical protein
LAKVYVTEHEKPSGWYSGILPIALFPPITTQTVAIGGGSTQSNAFSSTTRMIGVHTDAICSVEVGSNPTATANSKRMAANTTEYFEVINGHKIAVITNS